MILRRSMHVSWHGATIWTGSSGAESSRVGWRFSPVAMPVSALASWRPRAAPSPAVGACVSSG